MREGLTQAEHDMLEKAKIQEAEKEARYREVAKRENEKYGQMIELLKLYACIEPSVYRFVRVCEVLKNCIQVACRADADLDIVDYRWLRVGLDLLSANPHEKLQGDAYFHFSQREQDLMEIALKPLLNYLIKWSRKATMRYKDTYYVDALEVTIQDCIDHAMQPTFDFADAKTAWSFIFERDDNAGTIEYTGELFKGLAKYCKAEPWTSPYKIPGLCVGEPDEWHLEYRRAVACSKPDYLERREQFDAFVEKLNHQIECDKTCSAGEPQPWEELRKEVMSAGGGETWRELPSAKLMESFEARFAEYSEKRQSAISAALCPPKDESTPEKPSDPLVATGNEILDIMRRTSSATGYREFGVDQYLTMLERFLRVCLQKRQWGVFGNPIFIKLVIAIQNQAGFSCEVATQHAQYEGAWQSFSNLLQTYFKLFSRTLQGRELPDLISWISDHKRFTYSVGDSPSADYAAGYRGISDEICNGLFNASKSIALECYGAADEIELLYADVFPDDVDWYKFPEVEERHQPLGERYKEVDAGIHQLIATGPSMDCYMKTCQLMARGISIATQGSDSELPMRGWLRHGLSLLAKNPQGELTFENRGRQYYDESESDWVVNAIEQVGVCLREWAKVMTPDTTYMTTEEMEGSISGIPLVDKIDEIMRDVRRMVDGEWRDQWWRMVFDAPNEYNMMRYRSTAIHALIGALPPDNRGTSYVPVNTSRVKTEMAMPDARGGSEASSVEETPVVADEDLPPGFEDDDAEEAALAENPERQVTESATDEWTEFYGKTVFWYKISQDGTEIIDLSEEDLDDPNGLKTYRGITEDAALPRKVLAFFFRSFRDTLKIDNENRSVVTENEYVKPPLGRKWRSALDQIKDLSDFRQVQMEPQGKERDNQGRPINPSGKWRIKPMPYEWEKYLP